MRPEGSGLDHNFSPILTNIAIGYSQQASNNFIAKQVFPNVPVASSVGTFNKWSRGDFMRRQSKRMANFEAPPVAGFAVTQGNYTTDHYALSAAWTDQDLSRAAVGGITEMQFKTAKTTVLTNSNLIELELQTATLVQTAGNWSSTYAGVTATPGAGQFIQWDQAASDPVHDVTNWKEAMRLGYGIKVNTMVLPIQIWNSLKYNQSLIDRIKYGGTMDRPTQVTMMQLQALFELENILVPEAVYNTADEDTTDSYAYCWGAKTVWLGYVAAAPSVEEPSAGYHFSWTGETTVGLPQGIAAGAGPQAFGSRMSDEGLFVFEYTTNRPRAYWVDSEMWTTPNVTAADLGMTATAVIA